MNEDLISRSALMEKLGERARKYEYSECTELTIYEDMHEVKIAPAVDAVEVVRCRECKHCDPENYHCDHPMGTVAPLRREPDDFCSYGERKGCAD